MNRYSTYRSWQYSRYIITCVCSSQLPPAACFDTKSQVVWIQGKHSRVILCSSNACVLFAFVSIHLVSRTRLPVAYLRMNVMPITNEQTRTYHTWQISTYKVHDNVFFFKPPNCQLLPIASIPCPTWAGDPSLVDDEFQETCKHYVMPCTYMLFTFVSPKRIHCRTARTFQSGKAVN